MNAYAAYADDGCGSSGGHALFSDFSGARPDGFGEDRYIIYFFVRFRVRNFDE